MNHNAQNSSGCNILMVLLLYTKTVLYKSIRWLRVQVAPILERCCKISVIQNTMHVTTLFHVHNRNGSKVRGTSSRPLGALTSVPFKWCLPSEYHPSDIPFMLQECRTEQITLFTPALSSSAQVASSPSLPHSCLYELYVKLFMLFLFVLKYFQKILKWL
jgi:hypothetical protein